MLSPRRGFTMMEVLVVLALLAALAAVILVPLAGRARQGNAAALAASLPALVEGIQQFRGDVGRYPALLTQLTIPPAPGAADLCGFALPPGLLARWGGPYLDRPVAATGVPAGTAVILPTILRAPASGGWNETGELVLRAAPVDQDAAGELDAAFDGDGDLSSGAIRWSAAGDDTLRYVVPVRGC